MAETITTEQLLAKTGKKSFSTEELFGNTLPAKQEPSLPQYLKYKVTMDKANATRSQYGSQAMWGKADTQEMLKKGNQARDYWVGEAGPYEDLKFKEHPFKYVAGEAAQLIPYMVTSQVQGLKYGLTMGGGFAAITAVAGQAGPQVALPEEFFTVPVAFGAGMSTGYSYGVIKNILDREGGGLYLDMVEKGISEDTARMMALSGGTVIGVIELAQFGLLAKPFKQGFSKMLRTKVGRNVVANAIGRYAKSVGMNVTEEVLQEATSLTVETIASTIDEKPDAKPTREEWTKRLIETAQKSIAGLAVISAPGAVVDVATSKQSDAVKLQDMAKPEPTDVKVTITPTEKVAPAAPKVAKTPIVEPIAEPKPIPAKKPIVTKTLETRIQEIKEQFKRPETITRKEVKAVQEELIGHMKASELEAKDKAKFIKTIKNIQTPAQLDKTINDFVARVKRVKEQTKKASIGETIKKELTKTKPVKKGMRRVGKYDYESNKYFEEVRSNSKFTQDKAQALLDSLPEEVESELDLIKRRMLSLKANGATASLQIYEQVLKDIKTLKELGAAAKDDADFDNRLLRNEKVDEALINIDNVNANKKSIKTKIGNAYRRGFSNMYSMFNSIAGDTFAKKYDPELQENARNTAIYKKTTEITSEATKIYEQKNVMKVFESMSIKDYTITDVKDGLTIELSKLELIDIYNSIKNTKKQEDYFEAYGQEQVETLLGNLTSKDEAFADMLMESIQSYKEILNARHIETTGRDMGVVDNYWPATSEYQVSVIDDMKVQGETPSALKERVKSRVIPKPKNAWYKAGKHIGQAEHVQHLSREYETLKRLFNNRKVKHAIEQKFGEKVYQTITDQIDNVSLNKQTERIDAISSTFQKAINNWVTAKIAFNPSTYVRQLMSVGNYMENMSAVEWTKGFMEGILHPRQTAEYMWKNAPFLEARFKKGSTEAINAAIKGAESIGVNKASYVKALTSLVRSGDITAIIFGGYPLAKTQGFKAFESATLKGQQSGLSSSISQFQNSKNPFTRLFLAFKNTSNQYFRKQVDAIISYQNKDISAAQLAKTTLIYSVIQPIAYVSAGTVTREVTGALGRAIFGRSDEEDIEEKAEKLMNDIMTQLVVSPVNSIPLLNDLVKTAMRKATGQKIYNVLSIPWLDDIEKAMRKFTKKEVTFADYLEIAGAVLEPTTALPAATAIRYYKILTGNNIGESKQSSKI